MQETSTSPATILQFRQDIEAQFRRHIREALGCRSPRSSPPHSGPNGTSARTIAGIGTARSSAR